LKFYLGRLHEVSGKWSTAQRFIGNCCGTTNAKITQARQGLQLEVIEQEQRQRAIAQADPSNAELGLLVLEPASEIRTVAAQKFAQIMQIDYTARYSYPFGVGCTELVQLENCAFRSKLRKRGSLLWAILAEIQKIEFSSQLFPNHLLWLFAKRTRSTRFSKIQLVRG